MNCKPGDSAYIVRNVQRDACFENLLGLVVKVKRVGAVSLLHGPLWDIEDQILCPRCRCVVFYRVFDANLKPIIPPHEVELHDAVREHEQPAAPTAPAPTEEPFHASL